MTNTITIEQVWDIQDQLMSEFGRTHNTRIMHILAGMDEVATRVEDGKPLTRVNRATLHEAMQVIG